MKLRLTWLLFGGLAVSVASLVAQEAQPLAAPAIKAAPLAAPAVNPLISRIALGSCMKQDRPMPVLRTVREFQPELFVWLGDNIYGDTNDMDVLAAKYARLGRQPDFSALRAEVPMVATWDDHDYGVNDGGREYSKKEASKEVFLRFWGEPAETARRQRPGIYTSYRFTDPKSKRTLQLIVLDTRTFRSPLVKHTVLSYKNDYRPDASPGNTFLGAEQWAWLEEQLRQPADLRLIASSIQFAHEYNGYESWTNFPNEVEKMVQLIATTRANGVVFLSGDVHWGEISVLKSPVCYPLYDLTASGINTEWDTVEPNRNRLGEACREHHFGLIEIDWSAADPLVSLQVRDGTGRTRVKSAVRLSRLRF